ncbi:unnamed protein product [Prorocentrum cordatum]|uniref:Uncharacterized protein n=1 Tax=Prorocentrum cordatum TaxID=2364126 RepID=A0ABN9PWS3_9DINO|nr:unnamed protein product [Polarella glacialis]
MEGATTGSLCAQGPLGSAVARAATPQEEEEEEEGAGGPQGGRAPLALRSSRAGFGRPPGCGGRGGLSWTKGGGRKAASRHAATASRQADGLAALPRKRLPAGAAEADAGQAEGQLAATEMTRWAADPSAARETSQCSGCRRLAQPRRPLSTLRPPGGGNRRHLGPGSSGLLVRPLAWLGSAPPPHALASACSRPSQPTPRGGTRNGGARGDENERGTEEYSCGMALTALRRELRRLESQWPSHAACAMRHRRACWASAQGVQADGDDD